MNHGKERLLLPHLFWLSFTIALATVFLSPASAKAQQCYLQRAQYRFAGSASERALFIKARDDAITAMHALLRPLGGRLLRRYLKFSPSIFFEPRNAQLKITIVPYPPRTTPLDGASVTFETITGTRGTLLRTLRGGTIREVLSSNGRRRVIYYRFNEDCQTLRMDWHLLSRRWPEGAIEFSLSYRRQ